MTQEKSQQQRDVWWREHLNSKENISVMSPHMKLSGLGVVEFHIKMSVMIAPHMKMSVMTTSRRMMMMILTVKENRKSL